jgi:hypothetical protein
MKRLPLLFVSLFASSVIPAAVLAEPLGFGQIRNLNELTSPTEVGTTTIPSGNYIMTDQTSGKAYSLTVTERGTMILGPEGMQGMTGQPNARPSMKRSLEREVERGVENMIK